MVSVFYSLMVHSTFTVSLQTSMMQVHFCTDILIVIKSYEADVKIDIHHGRAHKPPSILLSANFLVLVFSINLTFVNY